MNGRANNGIARFGRGEDQPVDKERAQDPSSELRDEEQANLPGGQSKTQQTEK